MVRISACSSSQVCYWTLWVLVVALNIWNVWTSFFVQVNNSSKIDSRPIQGFDVGQSKEAITANLQSKEQRFNIGQSKEAIKKKSLPSELSKVQSSAEKQNLNFYFIPGKQLENRDFSSGDWWQSKKRFLKIFNETVIEDLNKVFFRFTERHKDLRMARDWLQFSVEHLSALWRITGYEFDGQTLPYQMIVDKLFSYTQHTLRSEQLAKDEEICPNSVTNRSAACSSHNAMRETIGIMEFVPHKSFSAEVRAKTLTTASLTATLASLVRVFCGRIVVVIDRDDFADPTTPPILKAVKEALLSPSFPERTGLEKSLELPLPQFAPQDFDFRLFSSEIALVVVDGSATKGTSKGKQRIVHKAALNGLFHAFSGSHATNPLWFGKQGAGYWKYIYFTETDTILQAKLDAFPAFSRELAKGRIVIPHRIQPIPHARNLPNDQSMLILPNKGKFDKVVALDASLGHACCDAGISKPGAYKKKDKKCGDVWWTCGFHAKTGLIEDHARLAPYELMELMQGTQIVTLAGTEHGRQCVPKTNGEPC